jgi:hypothetical protein
MLISCLATFLIATCHPSGQPADEMTALSFGATYAWIAAQAFVLMLPGLILGGLTGTVLPRLGLALGFTLMIAVPLVVLCDMLTFTWVAERFLSSTTQKISTTLLPSLMLYLTWPMIAEALLTTACAVLLLVVVWRVSGMAGRRWYSQEHSVKPLSAITVLLALTALLALPALSNHERTLSEMANASTRHPFCAFHIVGFRGVGVPSPSGRRKTIDRLRGLQAISAVHDRDQQQLALRVSQPALEKTANKQQANKVIVIVIECLRPEIIDPEVMPNLASFAEKSILCRQNFSSGNATCYGLFGFVTGLEAVWFRRPVKSQPILNRLFHEAGYEIAFYGGGGSATDWKHFNMDGYIAPEHYDGFQLEAIDLPDSDVRTVERAIEFIDNGKGGEQGSESVSSRMAVAYMFATHRRYSDPQDRVFQPAALEDSILRSPELKEQFYNRYKNSARTVDRLIKPLLRDDCTVVILGDHGEPLMDDGTTGHGTRLSRYQNMTPALIYSPGVVPRKIDLPTHHADLLPTLLSILDIPLTDPNVFDGIDLMTASDQTLAERSFVTRNYMDATSMLVGPWTFDSNQPFGYRVQFGITDWQSSYLNPIDELGFAWEKRPDHEGKDRFKAWVIDRFGTDAINESTSARDLFTRFFQSTDRETRLSALKIAADASDMDDYLYRLISVATRDHDREIREYAKDLVIRINRFRGKTRSE